MVEQDPNTLNQPLQVTFKVQPFYTLTLEGVSATKAPMTTKYRVQMVAKGSTYETCEDDLVSVVDGKPLGYIHADGPAQAAVAAALALGLTDWDYEEGEWRGAPDGGCQPTKRDMLYVSVAR